MTEEKEVLQGAPSAQTERDGLWPFPPGGIVTAPQEWIAALKECRCGGSLRDEEGSSPEGAWAFRQCRVCLVVYVLRFLVVIEPLRLGD